MVVVGASLDLWKIQMFLKVFLQHALWWEGPIFDSDTCQQKHLMIDVTSWFSHDFEYAWVTTLHPFAFTQQQNLVQPLQQHSQSSHFGAVMLDTSTTRIYY